MASFEIAEGPTRLPGNVCKHVPSMTYGEQSSCKRSENLQKDSHALLGLDPDHVRHRRKTSIPGLGPPSYPPAFLQGLGNDPNVPPTGCDLRRSISEDLGLNTTAPMPEDLGAAKYEPEIPEIR